MGQPTQDVHHNDEKPTGAKHSTQSVSRSAGTPMLRRRGSRKSSNALASANLRFHLFRALALPLLGAEAPAQMQPPVVIGAHGGSGTRVLPRVLRLAGYYMGSWVNPQTEDAMATRFFLERYFEEAIAARGEQRPELERAFRLAIRSHRIQMPDRRGPWGWKNPRCMWVIPFLAGIFPGMRFVHLIRDGRDLAISANLNLLRKHGALLLNDPSPERSPVRSQLRLWATGNQIAARDGERLLGPRYLRIKYETLCADPRGTMVQLYSHLGASVSPRVLDQAAGLVVPSRSIGAWREAHYQVLHEPEPDVRAALRRFGYLG